jgi:hypothetical protein
VLWSVSLWFCVRPCFQEGITKVDLLRIAVGADTKEIVSSITPLLSGFNFETISLLDTEVDGEASDHKEQPAPEHRVPNDFVAFKMH